jgi:hypothetical protein
VTPKPLWADVTEKYLSVITLYAKTSASTNNRVPPLVYSEACLKVAKMLTAIWISGGWGDDALKLIVFGGSVSEKDISEKWGHSHVSGVSRVDIAQWAMKSYGGFVEDMAITEQVIVISVRFSTGNIALFSCIFI